MSIVTVWPARPTSRHCCAYVLSVGSKGSRRVSESRTVSPGAMLPRGAQRGGRGAEDGEGDPCPARAPPRHASSTTGPHGLMAHGHLPGLGIAHNRLGGGGEIGDNPDAERARLADVGDATTGLHEQCVPAELARRLDVAQPVAHPIAALQVQSKCRLRVTIQLDPRLATLAGTGELGMMRAEIRPVESRVVCRE